MLYRLFTFDAYNKNRSVISRSFGITASLPPFLVYSVDVSMLMGKSFWLPSYMVPVNTVSRLVTGVPFFQLLPS
jgi:hypothetical protein